MEELVVRIEFGSHLYGTSTPQSDHDYKSVHIPSAEQILLQRVQDSTGHKVKRFAGDRNKPEDTDDESYSLQRYLNLLAEGQTVALDMLFTPSPIVTSSIWAEICANKDRLLTKRSAAFVGYCRAQANKYGIKGSRVDAARLSSETFASAERIFGTTAKVGEMQDILHSICSTGEHMEIVSKETTQGRFETYFVCCNRLVGFNNTIKEAAVIFTRIYENYGERSRKAQSNLGVDWKALSHAVRVGYEAMELLTTHHITFPLPNADRILTIKQGRVGYEEVAEEIERLLVSVEEAAAESTLRDAADSEFIDGLVREVYGNSVAQSRYETLFTTQVRKSI